MSAEVFPVEIEIADSNHSLGSFVFEWSPQPGAQLEIQGRSYVVLERRHRYTLKMNQYELSRILLSVKETHGISDRTWVGGSWVIGDSRCKYNARSALIRCAVNPEGPCDRCPSFSI